MLVSYFPAISQQGTPELAWILHLALAAISAGGQLATALCKLQGRPQSQRRPISGAERILVGNVQSE